MNECGKCSIFINSWNDMLGETKVLGEKPVPLPVRPPQISHDYSKGLLVANEFFTMHIGFCHNFLRILQSSLQV